MAEMATEQLSRVGRRRFATLGVPLLSDFMNIAILTGLLFLLQAHGWALPNENILAFVAPISLVVALFAFRGIGDAVWRRTTWRFIRDSVNDNLPPKPTPGSELSDALRRSRSAFLGVGLLSGLINILMLTGPLFLQRKTILENFAVGQTFGSSRLRVSTEQITSFATEFDPQPFYLDEEAAQDTTFQRLAASGWHIGGIHHTASERSAAANHHACCPSSKHDGELVA